MNIGIFGGSFSPVHRGHFEIATQLISSRSVDQLFVVPTYQNPFKQACSNLNDPFRLRLLEATFAGLDGCHISDFELNNKSISYSYKTVEVFANRFPQDQLWLVLGSDAFALFHKWSHLDRILAHCKLLVVGRQGGPEDLSLSEKATKGHLKWLDFKIPSISSTQIRQQPLATLEKARWLHPAALKIWLNPSLSL